jgi:maltose O-acetyltransferase
MAELSGNNISFLHGFFYDYFFCKPKNKIFRIIRSNYLKRYFKKVEGKIRISFNCKFIDIHNISVGANTAFANSSIFQGTGGLIIGNNCMIGFENILLTQNHQFKDSSLTTKEQGFYQKPICIGNNVWTGCRVIILPGVSIGDNSIIAAGSVVTKDIPKDVIAAGNPAKTVRHRD